MNARAATQLDVYKGDTRIGQLRRIEHGASFAYAPDYAAAHKDDLLKAAAFTLPIRAEPYDVFGTNLHPFFAGLLPEGLRLRALLRSAKTSQDDLFTLLAMSGADTVGDICIAAQGARPREHAPIAEIGHLPDASFDELLQQSLRDDLDKPEATIAGVQPKLSAATISFPLRAADRRRAYILKLTPHDYPKLAENEAFFMALAKRCGLTVANTKLVFDRTGRSGLLVERFDRAPRSEGGFRRVHQEDACQLLGRYPADKYRLTLSEITGALDVCSAPLPERLKLLRLQALSYLIANGDLHAKNVSIQVVERNVVLTPAYDLLSTLPYGDRRLALTMEGRDDKLKAAHFVTFGERFGLRRLAVEQMLASLCKSLAKSLPRLAEIGLDARATEHLGRVMRERMADLST